VPLPKGMTNNPNGRPKGSQNKSTAAAREAIARVVDANAEKLGVWLDEIYRDHGAKEALTSFKDLIEYHVAKLSRQELTGKDGGAIEVVGKVVYRGIDE